MAPMDRALSCPCLLEQISLRWLELRTDSPIRSLSFVFFDDLGPGHPDTVTPPLSCLARYVALDRSLGGLIVRWCSMPYIVNSQMSKRPLHSG